MPVAIRAIQPAFAGEVSGIDITQPVAPADVAAIEAGMDKYAVLVFRDQKLTDEQQMAFSLNFGALENARGGNVTKPGDHRLPTGMNDVSNLGKDHKPLARDSRQRLFNLGNMLWHSDSSFRAIPAKYSLLSARVVNPKGGDTEFADMRAAYDALDDETKREIEAHVCEHSLMYSRGSLGFLDYTDEEKAAVQARAPAPGAHAPGHGPQVALPLLPRRRHPRAADAGGPHHPARPQRARHPAALRLRAQVEAQRPRDVGQPPDHASRPPLRREPAPRRAPHHRCRRRPDRGATGRRIGKAAGPDKRHGGSLAQIFHVKHQRLG